MGRGAQPAQTPEVYGSATLAEALAFGEAVGLDKQTVLERARTSNFENARSKASAGVHFSFGIGLPFFGAVVAPAPAVVVPAPGYVLPPAYYPYPYPPVVAYGPPGYFGGSVVVWGHHYRGRGWHGDSRGR